MNIPLNKLDQLKQMTVVVADTGDIEAMRLYRPVDATTNPSLLLKAASLPAYASYIDEARQRAAKQILTSTEQVAYASCVLATAIGAEILKLIPGRISTEVDARLSFDTRGTLQAARQLIALYEQRGVSRDRVLIKIASTWEGLQAAKVLQKEGIDCNLTLLFCFEQAAVAADIGAFLISPFVGRILDWHKKHTGKDHYAAHEDPGVISVTQIYQYYKQHSYNTVVMGASFRNTGEIEQLAGCDRLTISPQLLDELSKDTGKLERKLDPAKIPAAITKPCLPENFFRASVNENAMATEKLSEGIRLFVADQEKLFLLLKSK